MTRKGPWLVSCQLAAVRPERYPSARHAELVHTGEDPVMCGASHQRQVDRVAPWVPVRLRMSACEKKYNQLNSGNALMVSERAPFLLSTSFMKSRKVDFYIFPFIDFGCMIEEKGRELLWEILKLKRVI